MTDGWIDESAGSHGSSPAGDAAALWSWDGRALDAASGEPRDLRATESPESDALRAQPAESE